MRNNYCTVDLVITIHELVYDLKGWRAKIISYTNCSLKVGNTPVAAAAQRVYVPGEACYGRLTNSMNIRRIATFSLENRHRTNKPL